MPWGYIVEWQEWFVPGAEVVAEACLPAPLCDGCVVDQEPPNEEECSTDINPVFPDCPYDDFDADCMPAIFLQDIVDELTPLCTAIMAAYPDICDSNILDGDSIPFVPFGGCCLLDCIEWMLTRKRGACVTLDDLPVEPPEDYPGTADEWIRCRTGLRHLILNMWPIVGEEYLAAKCLGHDLPPLFGTNDAVITYQSVQLPAGSYLVNEGCDTITTDDECEQCPPAV